MFRKPPTWTVNVFTFNVVVPFLKVATEFLKSITAFPGTENFHNSKIFQNRTLPCWNMLICPGDADDDLIANCSVILHPRVCLPKKVMWGYILTDNQFLIRSVDCQPKLIWQGGVRGGVREFGSFPFPLSCTIKDGNVWIWVYSWSIFCQKLQKIQMTNARLIFSIPSSVSYKVLWLLKVANMLKTVLCVESMLKVANMLKEFSQFTSLWVIYLFLWFQNYLSFLVSGSCQPFSLHNCFCVEVVAEIFLCHLYNCFLCLRLWRIFEYICHH